MLPAPCPAFGGGTPGCQPPSFPTCDSVLRPYRLFVPWHAACLARSPVSQHDETVYQEKGILLLTLEKITRGGDRDAP